MSNFQLVRYKAGKHHFELMTEPGTVLKFREGKVTALDDVVTSDVIFKDHGKGEKANAADIEAAFPDKTSKEILETIVRKGELQLTTKERKEKVEKKRREIVNYIHKYCIDPRSKLPHPVTRIEAALDDMKFRVDGDIPAERQTQDVLKKLSTFLPYKRQTEINGVLKVPHKHIGSLGGVLANLVTVTSENYGGDGVTMQVSVVPGDYDKLVSELENKTKGDYSFEVEGQAAAQPTDEPAKKGGKKGKGKKAKK